MQFYLRVKDFLGGDVVNCIPQSQHLGMQSIAMLYKIRITARIEILYRSTRIYVRFAHIILSVKYNLNRIVSHSTDILSTIYCLFLAND
ncbi:hypothetical protein WJ02_14620 [Burkholderia vietnamiensis]|nr:hypothetical protein WJ02_14620 [Burkholderia vietnamiensis]